MKGLEERLRQELDLARERPLEPAAPRVDIFAQPSAPPAPPAAIGLKARLKLRLRALPLLGGLLAWANSLRRLNRTRQQLELLLSRQTISESRHAASESRQARAESQIALAESRFADLASYRAAADALFSQVAKHLAMHDEGLQSFGRLLVALEERLNGEHRDLESLRQDLTALLRQTEQQRGELTLLQRQASPRAATAPSAPAAASSALLDAYYAAFEDSFRGGKAEIKQRLSVYLDHLAAANIKTSGKPILDLGCGRGEWLEMLGETGYPAYGVDLNALNVLRAEEAGLDIRQEDALLHLRGLPDASLAAVTAFHLIEHLPFELLLELVQEASRVVAPGGLIILETPNPENIRVGACSFYNDPTHRHPIPPSVARFLVENRGFLRVEILPLHPCPDSERVAADSDLAKRFNQFFYGPQDYAVIGHKI